MKKNWKYFLMGAGAVVAGFFAYALLKDRPEDDIIAEPASDWSPITPSSEHHNSTDYVARRREILKQQPSMQTSNAPDTEKATPTPVPVDEITVSKKSVFPSPPDETDGSLSPGQEPHKDDETKQLSDTSQETEQQSEDPM